MILSEFDRTFLREKLLNVLLNVLHHQEDILELIQTLLLGDRNNHIYELRGEYVPRHFGQLVQQVKLPDHVPGLIFAVENVIDQFNRHFFISIPTNGKNYLSVNTGTQLLNDFIFLGN